MKPEISAILEVLSNPVRSRVLSSLGDTKTAKYSELLKACTLDPYSESGKLGYHLQQLVSLGLVSREDTSYSLTERGRGASRLMAGVEEMGREILAATEGKTCGVGERIQVREADYLDLDDR